MAPTRVWEAAPASAAPVQPREVAQDRARDGRRHPVRAAAGGSALLLVGTLTTAAGAAVAVRWAQKTGLSATTVVAVLAAVAGLVVAIRGTRTIWRALRGRYRLVLVPVAVLLLLLASCVGLAAVYAQAPPTELGSATPASHGLSYDDVRMTTADGAELSGWLVPSGNGAAVVLLHGSGSTRTATLEHAAVLADHGYGVLMVDARGHGRSGGDGMDLGWYGDADIAAMVSFLQDAGTPRERIALVGLSMGGEQAVGAAAAVPGLRAVVAEGVTSRTAADKDAWLPGGVSGWVQRRLDAVTYALVDRLTAASPPTPLRDAVRQAEGTTFLLIAAGGMPDEGRAAAVLRDTAPDRVHVWTVPDAGHTRGLAVDPSGWEERTVAFLDRNLR